MPRLFFIVFLVFFISSSASADQFIVHSFEHAPNDLAARRYERLDFNDQACPSLGM